MTMHILVVDDDPRILAAIASILDRENLEATLADSGFRALAAFDARRADLVVLDVAMPDMDGVDVFRAIRERSGVPVLFLPARDQEIGRLLREGLEGFDYAAKPLSAPEFLQRIHALRERTTGKQALSATLRHGRLLLRPGDGTAFWDGRSMDLERTELLTLEMMVRQPTRLFSRESIMVVAFGLETSPCFIDSHVEGICRKFREAGCPELIGIVCGVGFTLSRAD